MGRELVREQPLRQSVEDELTKQLSPARHHTWTSSFTLHQMSASEMTAQEAAWK